MEVDADSDFQATVRDQSTDTTPLESLRKTLPPQNKLIVAILSSTAEDGVKDLITTISDKQITHIDTIIANAGYGTSFTATLATSLADIRADFEINTLSVVRLFIDSFALLSKSTKPKFVLISSALGSIEGMDASPSLGYGMSKAAADYAVRKIHFEHQDIVSLAIYPG